MKIITAFLLAATFTAHAEFLVVPEEGDELHPTGPDYTWGTVAGKEYRQRTLRGEDMDTNTYYYDGEQTTCYHYHKSGTTRCY